MPSRPRQNSNSDEFREGHNSGRERFGKVTTREGNDFSRSAKHLILVIPKRASARGARAIRVLEVPLPCCPRRFKVLLNPHHPTQRGAVLWHEPHLVGNDAVALGKVVQVGSCCYRLDCISL